MLIIYIVFAWSCLPGGGEGGDFFRVKKQKNYLLFVAWSRQDKGAHKSLRMYET